LDGNQGVTSSPTSTTWSAASRTSWPASTTNRAWWADRSARSS